jgi:hypothetical protein
MVAFQNLAQYFPVVSAKSGCYASSARYFDMMRVLMILCVSLLLLGCKDQGVGVQPEPGTSPHNEPVSTLVPEVVGVVFADGVTTQEADQFVSSLGLSFKFAPTGSPLSGMVSVPAGSENQWVEQLKTYSIVKSASRITVTVIVD